MAGKINKAEFVRRCEADIVTCGAEASKATIAGDLLGALVWQVKVPIIRDLMIMNGVRFEADLTCFEVVRVGTMREMASVADVSRQLGLAFKVPCDVTATFALPTKDTFTLEDIEEAVKKLTAANIPPDKDGNYVMSTLLGTVIGATACSLYESFKNAELRIGEQRVVGIDIGRKDGDASAFVTARRCTDGKLLIESLDVQDRMPGRKPDFGAADDPIKGIEQKPLRCETPEELHNAMRGALDASAQAGPYRTPAPTPPYEHRPNPGDYEDRIRASRDAFPNYSSHGHVLKAHEPSGAGWREHDYAVQATLEHRKRLVREGETFVWHVFSCADADEVVIIERTQRDRTPLLGLFMTGMAWEQWKHAWGHFPTQQELEYLVHHANGYLHAMHPNDRQMKDMQDRAMRSCSGVAMQALHAMQSDAFKLDAEQIARSFGIVQDSDMTILSEKKRPITPLDKLNAPLQLGPWPPEKKRGL